MKRQQGASGVFVVIVLLLLGLGIAAVLMLGNRKSQVQQGTQIVATFQIIQDALVQYVTANGRLPCPANPTLNPPDVNAGNPDPNAASATCTAGVSATGTVPWKAIGIRAEDAIDPWGNKISYRVYSGSTGLTQAGGASMVNCDTVEVAPAGVDAAGLCRTTQDTREADFLAGKGLKVNDFGTSVTDAAYVLISHGPSGLGAFTSAGQRKMPLPANAAELANTNATPATFIALAASAPTVGAEDPTHFDDLLAYAKIADLIKRAGLGGRDWPDAPAATIAQVKIDAPTMAAASGGTTPAYGDLGTVFLSFTGASVVGANSGGVTDLSYENSGGYDGLGVAGAMISSVGNEFLIIPFSSTASKFAVTLANFGSKSCTSGTCNEQVSLVFFNGSTNLGTVTKSSCNADGGLASFSVDVKTLFGSDFDGVIVAPQATNPPDTSTEFLLSEFKTCDASGSCTTSLADTTNACP